MFLCHKADKKAYSVSKKMHFKETEKVLTYIYKFFKGKCSDKKGQEGKVFPYLNREN